MSTERSSTERSSTLAIASLTTTIFVGTQVLARLSNGSPNSTETVAALAASVVLVLAVVGAMANSRLPKRAWVTSAHNVVPAFRKPILVVGSLLFAVLPRIEVGRYPAIGLPARILLGAVLALVVAGQANRWLLGLSVATIVLHRWTHPTMVTVIFVGLILLGFALCTRSEMDERGYGHPPKSLSEPSPSGVVAGRAIRHSLAMIAAITISLAGGLLLSDQARHLAWDPNASDGRGRERFPTGSDAGPRERFGALSAEDQLDLAYRPTGSTQEVMTLFTDQQAPIFLRAQTFDRWTGRTWNNRSTVAYEPPDQLGMWSVRPTYRDDVRSFLQRRSTNPSAGSDPDEVTGVNQTVIQAKVAFTGYIPAPVEPIAIVSDGEAPQSRWRSDGTIAPDGGQGPALYVVVHQTRHSTSFDLSGTGLLDISGISPRVKALALEIVRGHESPESKARAISNWVTENIRYDLSAPRPGAGADPIEHLLFTTKAGSCTHFATATAALFRSVGIPTRVATGFVGQTQVGPGQILVRAKDAHAWAEVPLVGGGWHVSDTTLGAREAVSQPGNPSPWLFPALLLVVATLVVIYVSLRHVRSQRRSYNQRLWVDMLKVGRTVGVSPTLPVSYRHFSQELDVTLGMNGTFTDLGSELDRRAFGPSATPTTTVEQRGRDRTTVAQAQRLAAELRKDRRKGIDARSSFQQTTGTDAQLPTETDAQLTHFVHTTETSPR